MTKGLATAVWWVLAASGRLVLTATEVVGAALVSLFEGLALFVAMHTTALAEVWPLVALAWVAILGYAVLEGDRCE